MIDRRNFLAVFVASACIYPQHLFASVIDFGAKGNGVADDTSAIQRTIDQSSHVYFPPGKYLHTGINVPKGRSLIGSTWNSTELYLKDQANPAAGVTLEGPKIRIENMAINGNRQQNLNCDGIAVRDNAQIHFVTLSNLMINNFGGTGVVLNNANMAHIQNCSITRCGIGVKIGSSRPITFTNVDIAKFVSSGIQIKRTKKKPIIFSYTSGFMESYPKPKDLQKQIPTENGATFIKMDGLNSLDNVIISGVWMNGHYDTHKLNTVGYNIVNSDEFPTLTITNSIMHGVKISALVDNEALQEDLKQLLKIVNKN